MSEDFDKEAERERLREKYEADREDREATERMSELLLQGATMTNMHCDVCGSPIFRYQGQEFCPTCGEERGGGAADPGPESEDAGAQGGDPHGAVEPQGADAGAAGGQQAGGGTGADDAAREAAGQSGDRPPIRQSGTDRAESGGAGTGQPGPGQPTGGPSGSEQPAGGISGSEQPAAGSLDAARASLVRTITTYAQRAEAAEDPRKARELLGAAEAAAETLARLDGD